MWITGKTPLPFHMKGVVIMKRKNVSKYFGCMVFDDRVMKARLSAKVYQSLRKTIDEGVKLDSSVADAVAEAMKDWAVSVSYTHLI